MSEPEMDQERVRQEHLDAVNTGAHWAYLLTVLVGGFVLMVALIGVLGATAQ